MKVESKVIAYLGGLLDCEVAADVPNPRPDRLVTVGRDGGGSDSIVIDRPRVSVEAWGETRATALELCQEVEALMDALPHTDWCYRAQKSGDSYFPGEGQEPRYLLVYDLACDPRA